MYSAKFINQNGNTLVLDIKQGIAFDILLSGIPINLSLANNQNVGNTIVGQNISGRQIIIKGAIWNDIPNKKNLIQRIFAPFNSGNLIINDEFSIFVYVKSSPDISPKKDNGKFGLELFAPMPFFRKGDYKIFSNSVLTKKIHFPVNYSMPHILGETSFSRYINLQNNGETMTPFELSISTKTALNNVVISDTQTGKFLKFNGEISASQELIFDKDADGYLRVRINEFGELTDAFNRLDETSSLFDINVGTTKLSVGDEWDGEANVVVKFHELVGSFYEY